MDTPILINADVKPQVAGDSLPAAAKSDAKNAFKLSKHAAQLNVAQNNSA